MSPAKSLDCATPLLEAAPTNDHHGEEETRKGWWKKVMDVEEAKNQVLFSLPMIVTNVCYYAIPLVSVMFSGHLGQLELAGASLANSWATVTGFAFMVSFLFKNDVNQSVFSITKDDKSATSGNQMDLVTVSFCRTFYSSLCLFIYFPCSCFRQG